MCVSRARVLDTCLRPSHRQYSYGIRSYGLYSYGIYRYGLDVCLWPYDCKRPTKAIHMSIVCTRVFAHVTCTSIHKCIHMCMFVRTSSCPCPAMNSACGKAKPTQHNNHRCAAARSYKSLRLQLYRYLYMHQCEPGWRPQAQGPCLRCFWPM